MFVQTERNRTEQISSKFSEAYSFRGYNKGARSIYMRLPHTYSPMHMNVKKIRRLMKKYGLVSVLIRKANPYRRIGQGYGNKQHCPEPCQP